MMTLQKKILVLGLLPLWLSFALLFLGTVSYTNAEYWNSAPWIVVGAIPISVLTSVVVAIYHAVTHKRPQSEPT